MVMRLDSGLFRVTIAGKDCESSLSTLSMLTRFVLILFRTDP